nr:anther-specific proline-rich protein APG-like [Paramormyrops kingsleyae]
MQALWDFTESVFPIPPSDKWNVRSQQRKGGKLEKDLLGPFKILAIEGKNADLLGEDGTKFLKINVDHLVPYVEDVPQIPHKPQKSFIAKQSDGVPSSPVPRIPPTPTKTASRPPSPSPVLQISPSPTKTASRPPSPSPVPRIPPSPTKTASRPPSPSPVPPIPPTPPKTTSSTPCPSPASSSAVTYISKFEKSVDKAWSGRVWDKKSQLLGKIGPYKFFNWDIGRLAPGRQLESEVINAYIFAMVRKHNQISEDKAFMIDSFAMAKVWQGSYNILRKWNPKEYQMVLGVIGEHGHWTLAVHLFVYTFG